MTNASLLFQHRLAAELKEIIDGTSKVLRKQQNSKERGEHSGEGSEIVKDTSRLARQAQTQKGQDQVRNLGAPYSPGQGRKFSNYSYLTDISEVRKPWWDPSCRGDLPPLTVPLLKLEST